MATKKRFQLVQEKRHVYFDHERQKLSVFYKIGDKLAQRHFDASSAAKESTSIGIVLGFCAGMVEAERQINTTPILWLTPDEYTEHGGKFET